MKWADNLTVKQHLAFVQTIERSTADLPAVLTCYESQNLFNIMRDLTDDEIFSIKDRDDVYGAMMHTYELRLREVLRTAKNIKPKERILTGDVLRQQTNQLISNIELAAGDYITYMAYCEYVALRQEGQTDALNATWEEWQENVTIVNVLESFYNRVADERLESWRKSLDVESRQDAAKPNPAKDKDIPLEKESKNSL